MSFLRRNGKPGTALVPFAQPQSRDDGWGPSAKPIESGVWLVVKLPASLKEGGYSTTINAKLLTEADSGIEAIKKLYQSEHRRVEDDNPSAADGRYVALDFYGGDRVEALVTGDWKVDILVAPPRLGK